MSEFRVQNRTFHCLLMHFDYRTPSTAIREPLPTKPSNGTHLQTEHSATWAKRTVRHILSYFIEFSTVKTILKSHCSHCLSTARSLHCIYSFTLTFKDEDIAVVVTWKQNKTTRTANIPFSRLRPHAKNLCKCVLTGKFKFKLPVDVRESNK